MTETAKTGAQIFATYVLSLAMFALAAALIYFAYQVSRVTTQIPDILTSVDSTSNNVVPIITEVGEIRKLIPDILHEVEETRKMVPPILKEVEQTRLQIPPILKEVEQTRQQIPPILKEVEAVRKEVPAITKSTDNAAYAVVVMSKEIKATRPLVPEILKEVETTRESIPPLMDRAEAMIDKARKAGEEASSGAVSGFFKGLVTAPFALVGDAGKAVTGMSDEEIKKFTDKDIDLFKRATLDLLNNGKKGDTRNINNPDSGNSATIKLVSIESKEEDFTTVECRILQTETYKSDERVKTSNRHFCREEGGGWEIE
jgi:hypothetical protein